MRDERLSDGHIIFGESCEKQESVRQGIMVKNAFLFGKGFNERYGYRNFTKNPSKYCRQLSTKLLD